MKKKPVSLFLILLVLPLTNTSTVLASNKTFDYQKEYILLKKQNDNIENEIRKLQDDIAAFPKDIENSSGQLNNLSDKNYQDEKELKINNNIPSFSKEDLNVSHGSWQVYSELDSLNRAHTANALLNKSSMPIGKREPLTWDPTGWHNKRLKNGWLYNRSHLIGYQLSGQNNNPKNLITGTRELNSPEMLAHEMDIAYYLKNNPNDYVRYRVTPIYRNNELLARGVQMEAQSINSNTICFNVYIFNVQDGVTINYSNGTSQINS